MRALLTGTPAFALNYVAFLSDRIRFLNRRLACLGAGSAARRLAAWLDASIPDGAAEYELPLSLSRLPDALGVSRASLYRALDELEAAGHIAVLSGTTGFGMAQLMEQSSKGASALKYTFRVESDASNILPALLNGSVDIAALPTNAAANLYAKKAGAVQVLAVNTLGVLYVVTGEGVSVSSFEDLKGKTVYCPAQNPTFIFTALCRKNGLEPGKDITIDNTYAQPAELRTVLAAGKVDIAVLPEPMVTIARSANDKLTAALDLTAAWSAAFGESAALAQGCVVVRTAFAEAHPAEVAAFLAEYEASVKFVMENPAEAGTMIETQGIFAKGAVAAKAIPHCNLCFITGQEMADKLTSFYTTLFGVAPASIGGAVPDNGLYYGVK